MQVSQVKTDTLIPYAKNARTHSPEQVGQIAASIKEFGFNNPILVDGEKGVIAGHGRLLAAQKLGLDEVPVIELGHMSVSMRRNGVADFICSDCGAEFTARKDTNPIVCKACGCKRGGCARNGPRVKHVTCKVCANTFPESRGYTYCSLACRAKDAKTERYCKHCGKGFYIYKSLVNGKSNSSGNFCSRGCYETWMCDTKREGYYGAIWRKARLEALKLKPFCAICGKGGTLDVHHIAPYRLSNDNSIGNLIPLCKSHHKTIEFMTQDIVATGSSVDDIKFILGNILRCKQEATLSRIMMVKRRAAPTTTLQEA